MTLSKLDSKILEEIVENYKLDKNHDCIERYDKELHPDAFAIIDFGKKYFTHNNQYIIETFSEEILSLGKFAAPREKLRYVFELFIDSIYLLDAANNEGVVKKISGTYRLNDINNIEENKDKTAEQNVKLFEKWVYWIGGDDYIENPHEGLIAQTNLKGAKIIYEMEKYLETKFLE